MRILLRSFFIAIIFSLVTSCTVDTNAGAPGLPTVQPEEVGLSSERLERLESVIQGYVDRGEVAGAVTLIARHGGEAHIQAYGMADIDDGAPMEVNTIFRMASMSKQITSIAVMMLYEEGRFRLNDPVGQYLPELSSLEVLEITDPESGEYRLVPSERPVTIRHLLTHTSGITYRMWGEWMNPSDQDRIMAELYRDAGVSARAGRPGTLEDLVICLGNVPLKHQPGTAWTYGLNDDVLGWLIEVVSGTSLDEFLHTRMFEPLKMEDTYFYLPPEKEGRLAALYAATPDGDLAEVHGLVESEHIIYSDDYPTGDQRTFFSGGGGLLSTARDYSRFLQMLLNGGELEGVRLLSPLTVDMILSTNHFADLPSLGWGLGFSITGQPDVVGELAQLSEGSYSWSGAFSTYFWVEPKEDLIGIVFAQRSRFEGGTDIYNWFRFMTHQAIVE